MRLWELNIKAKISDVFQRVNRTCTLIINLFIILNIRFYCTFIVVKGNQLLDAMVWYATTHAEGLYVIQLHNRNNVLWLAWVAAKGINENASKTSCDNEKVFYSCSKWRIGHSKGLEKICIFVCLQHSFQLISYHVMQFFQYNCMLNC